MLENKLPNSQTTSVVVLLIKFIVEHKYFKFQDKYSKKATQWPLLWAPQDANAFLANLEEIFILKKSQKSIFYFYALD